ncbi:hypothetical protein BDR07DRAFT_1459021 [Suillus spraguei]|nr:hypothetical protein BDR07DRAFT_1459021 [Suillus spraguei]
MSATNQLRSGMQFCKAFEEALSIKVVKIKVGSPSEYEIYYLYRRGRLAYDKIMGFAKKAKDAEGGDDLERYFIQPTIILIKDLDSITMKEEIFGPIIVYECGGVKTLGLINSTSPYALTSSMSVAGSPQHALTNKYFSNFAADRKTLPNNCHTDKPRNAAGNVYYNEACTDAAVGRQPFERARASGTNDKIGSY